MPVESLADGKPSRNLTLLQFLAILANICWAGNIVAVKVALRGFSSMALVQLRILGAAAVFLSVFRAWRKHPSLDMTLRQWRLVIILALTLPTLNQVFFITGVNHTSVSHTGLIVALAPVMVLALAGLMHMESITAAKSVGMVLAFVGVAVLTLSKTSGGMPAHWMGDLLVLCGDGAFAAFTIKVKKISNQYNALTLNTLIYGIGALLLLPFGVPAFVSIHWNAIPAVAWAGVAYTVVLGTAFPYLVYTHAMTELTASRVASYNYLQPVVATILGISLLAEKFTLMLAVGGTLILLGVFLTGRKRTDKYREMPLNTEPIL